MIRATQQENPINATEIASSTELPATESRLTPNLRHRPSLAHATSSHTEKLLEHRHKHLPAQDAEQPIQKQLKTISRLLLWLDLSMDIARGIKGVFISENRTQGPIFTFLVNAPLIGSLFSATLDGLTRAYGIVKTESAVRAERARDIQEHLEAYEEKIIIRNSLDSLIAESVGIYRHNKKCYTEIEDAISEYFEIKHGQTWFLKDLVIDPLDAELGFFIQRRKRDLALEYLLDAHYFAMLENVVKKPTGKVDSEAFYRALAAFRNENYYREKRNLALAEIFRIYQHQKALNNISDAHLNLALSYYLATPVSNKTRKKALAKFFSRYNNGEVQLDTRFNKDDITSLKRLLDSAYVSFKTPKKTHRQRKKALAFILAKHQEESLVQTFESTFAIQTLSEDTQKRLNFLLLFEDFAIPYHYYHTSVDPLQKRLAAIAAAQAYRHYGAEKTISEEIQQYNRKYNDTHLRGDKAFEYYLKNYMFNVDFKERLEDLYKNNLKDFDKKQRRDFAVFFGISRSATNEKQKNAALARIIKALRYQKTANAGIINLYDNEKKQLGEKQKHQSLSKLINFYNTEKETAPKRNLKDEHLEKASELHHRYNTPYYGLTPANDDLEKTHKSNLERELSTKRRKRALFTVGFNVLLFTGVTAAFLVLPIFIALGFAVGITFYLYFLENREANRLVKENHIIQNRINKLEEQLAALDEAAEASGHPDHDKYLYYLKEIEIQKNNVKRNTFDIGMRRIRCIGYTLGITLGFLIIFAAPPLAVFVAGIIFATFSGMFLATTITKNIYKKTLEIKNNKLKIKQPAPPEEIETAKLYQVDLRRQQALSPHNSSSSSEGSSPEPNSPPSKESKTPGKNNLKEVNFSQAEIASTTAFLNGHARATMRRSLPAAVHFKEPQDQHDNLGYRRKSGRF